MAATSADISGWFDQGNAQQADFMIVVCDTYDHEDYPVYATESEVHKKHAEHNGVNMQRVMEVYDLRMDKATQMAEFRANHLPNL